MDGRRASKTVGGVETDYYHDASGRVIATYGGGCGITCSNSDYIYLRSALAAVYTNSTTYFAITDQLGSTRLVTGYPTRTVAECDDYYPFGERISCGANGTTPFEFTGYQRDAETNLDDANARYFASSLGRFMSPDPSGLSLQNPADPQSLNLYSYVRNSPLVGTDPTGMDDYCLGLGPPCMNMDASVPGSAAFMVPPGAWSIGADVSVGGSGGIDFGNNEFDALNAEANQSPTDPLVDPQYNPQGNFSASASGWSWSPDSFTALQYTDSFGQSVYFNSWNDYSNWSTGMAGYEGQLNAALQQGGYVGGYLPNPDYSGSNWGINFSAPSSNVPTVGIPPIITASKPFSSATKNCIQQAKAAAETPNPLNPPSTVLQTCMENSGFWPE